jgi:hypothetical protein
MKYTLITLGAAALLSMGSIAVADEPTQGPIAMTDAQMDQVVAGARGADLMEVDVRNTPRYAVTYVGDPLNTDRNDIRAVMGGNMSGGESAFFVRDDPW